MGSMTLSVKEHSQKLCEKLQSLRSDTNLVDLDLVCEDQHLHVHKVIMAASSKFFKEELSKSVATLTRGPVILKLEDFHMKLKREAVSHIVEFIYKGEIVIPANLLSPVCEAAHNLGVHDLIDFLPAPAKKTTPPTVQESSTQIDDESFGNASSNSSGSSSSDNITVPGTNSSSTNTNETGIQAQQPNNGSQQLWPSANEGSSNSFSTVIHTGMDFFHQTAAAAASSDVVQPQLPHQPFQGYPTTPQMNPNHHQYKPFYYQDSNNVINNSEETTIIDLDSNDGMVQTVTDEQLPDPITAAQPKGRLRIINQPDGPLTENIHDLKSSSVSVSGQTNLETHPSGPNGTSVSANAFINWMPNTNNLCSLASLDQQQHTVQQQQSASFDMENSLWYNQFSYNEEPGPSWNTPATAAPPCNSTSATPPSSMPWPLPETVSSSQTGSTSGSGTGTGSGNNLAHDNEQDSYAEHHRDSSLIMGLSDNSLEKSPMSKANKGQRENLDEIKLRPPPPLLAKGSPRMPIKSSSSATGSIISGSGSNNTTSTAKRPELEVRKDLTLPTAPTAREDNVFQADEDLPLPIEMLEIEETSNSSNGENCVKTSHDKNFKCSECPMIFTSSGSLRSHTRHTHKPPEDTLLFCPVCKTAVLHGLENLKLHLYKSHGIGEVLRCEECNFETATKSNYTKHMTTHSEELSPKKLRMCNKCGKPFKSRCGLKLHMQTHDSEDMLNSCTFCDFKTPQKANLIKHLAVKHKKDHQGQELKMNKACPLCQFKCVADHILKAHMLRKHTSKEKMKYRCSHCDYATVEGAALKKHVRFKHTNERPYMCSTCGFSTHTHSAMARHKRGHEQSKPYACKTCGMAYADRKRLRDHESTHQSGNLPLPFDCDFCGYSTRRKDNLQAHIKRLHPDLASQSQRRHNVDVENRPKVETSVTMPLPGSSDSIN